MEYVVGLDQSHVCLQAWDYFLVWTWIQYYSSRWVLIGMDVYIHICDESLRPIIWEGIDTDIKHMGPLTSLLSQFLCTLLP